MGYKFKARYNFIKNFNKRILLKHSFETKFRQTNILFKKSKLNEN